MSKALDNIMYQALSDHDIPNWVSDELKDSSNFVSINTEELYSALMKFYKAGFKDGYKTHRGDNKDDFGNWEKND